MSLRILVVDGYTRTARDELVMGGAKIAAHQYVKMLTDINPGAQCDVLFPADPDASLPTGVGLAAYDGIAWTGCSLTIYDGSREVAKQIDFARAAFRAGVPSFGSCWAAQIAVVAAGGTCQANPKGREMGIARKIALSSEGRNHLMYDGKPSVFDAFISHVDEITLLPSGTKLLAGNSFTKVQAVAVNWQGGTFWGLQYHPEYDLHEMARLSWCRINKLVDLGFFADREAGESYVSLLEKLHEDPSRKDLAWLLGIDEDVTDLNIRQLEVRNWIEHLVIPMRYDRERT